MVESARNYYIRKYESEIRTNSEYIKQNETKIVGLRKSDLNPTYVNTQIQKIKEKLEEFSKINKELESSIFKITLGELDSKFEDDIAKELKKQQLTKQRKQQQAELEVEPVEPVYNQSRQPTEYEMDKAYKYFKRVCDETPDYILKQLKHLPNNKGIIFRGVHFYGSLPPTSKTIEMVDQDAINLAKKMRQQAQQNK